MVTSAMATYTPTDNFIHFISSSHLTTPSNYIADCANTEGTGVAGGRRTLRGLPTGDGLLLFDLLKLSELEASTVVGWR